MPQIRVAACQVNTVVGDLAGNVGRTLGALAAAERSGADLAVLPELTVTGYPPEDLLGRPAFVADNLAAFAEVVAGTGDCAAVVGYVDQNHDVTQVCTGTGKLDNMQYYLDRKRETGNLHGQAPVLWAAAALLRDEK